MEGYFEIYFEDLNKKAQREYLEFMGVECEGDLNQDVLPIATIARLEDQNE